MATYFHGNPSEIHGGGGGAADGLQTLILMNPAYVGYSDNNQQPPPQSSNFVFLNSNSAGNNGNTHRLPHAPPPSQTQRFVGIPLQGTTTSPSTASPHDGPDVSALHGFLPPPPPPRVHYSLYNLPVDLGAAARDVTRAQQGLSLSLSSEQPPPGYGSYRAERPEMPPIGSPARGDDVRVSGGSPSSASGVNGVQSVLLSSKYLKAAQELLDEVVNVGRGGKSGGESTRGQPKSVGDAAAAASGDGQSGGESSAKRAAELSTAERQEIQMKKAKLVNMLDEVDQRYRQYHHQMQIVISWFEQAAGVGSAKTYTALALQTISKQFRCLKDAILSQIRGASKSLGEEESFEGKMEGSRLKYVDNQIRQQRALQQLGMIQHNAWRPQRGLPERSVSVLRAWLFEHFLHPYPKDSDKLMLAKQTGLTRSQVSNWFINARVRLWKPMVEEMYMEEMKEHEKNGSDDNNNRTSKSEQNEDSTTKSATFQQAKSPVTDHLQNKPIRPMKQDIPVNPNIGSMMSMSNSMSPNGTTTTTTTTTTTMRHNIPGFNIIGQSEIESIAHNSPKKLRIGDMLMNIDSNANKPPNTDSDNDGMTMKFGDERQGRDAGGFTIMGGPANFIGGFGSYPMGELGRFGSAEQFQGAYSGNGVSLTLGLPHCENMGGHQSFLPNQSMQLGRGVEIGETNDFVGMNAHQTNDHSTNMYENISIQDRKRFAAQLLPDFVA